MRVYCGQVNKQHLNKEIELYGWIKKNRKLGSLIFLDLYDKTGIVQIALNDKNKLFDLVHSLSKESVIKVIGKVVERSNPNLELATGKYEISLKDLEVISKADNTPFVVSEDTDANEDIRLKYRYLDLRRECVRSKIQLRAKAVQTIRDFLINEAFEEVETPILCRPTPEGAKDYLVPTRNKAKAFFALPQSPQTFKQLLMVAGFDRYFQIARCFRDEPLRSDRQPEFSQVDIEMSFIQESDIQDLIERMMKTLFKKTLNIDIKIPFKRIDFDVAMNEYGCDKPDLRFDNKIQDLSNYFTNTNFKIFKSVVDQKNKIKAVIFEKINAQKADITKLEKFAKDNGAKGLAWLTVKDNKIIDGSIAKVIEPEIITKILADRKIKSATLLFVADENEIANKSLGAVRIEAAKLFNIIDESKYEFCWIVNWPLFEYDSDQKRYVAAHHPFTSPTSETLKDFDTNKKDAKARSYDIVLNGYEVGGGSIRIADAKIQQRMFKALELTDKEITNKFGFLIEAFKYGVPIHGGLALGLDRLIMLMTNANSIKDVIAFPKNSAGNDLMLEGPSSLNEEELGELHLKYADKK